MRIAPTDAKTGTVIGKTTERHTSDEFVAFLGQISPISRRVRRPTTKEKPLERFARDEQATLLAPSGRPYQSLILRPRPTGTPAKAPLPRVPVERRPLKTYAAIAAGAL